MNIFRKITGDLLRYLKYEYGTDPVLDQERFEPATWVFPIEKQIGTLRKYFPNIEMDGNYFKSKISTAPRKNFVKIVLPKISFLGKKYKVDDPYADIGILMEKACELIDTQREGKFTHYRKGQLGRDRIRCTRDAVVKRKRIEEKIPGDALILDVDLGNIFAGWTPRLARESIFKSHNYMALFALDIALIILINPRRFQQNTDLSVDSVAEEYLSTDRGWVTNLFFYFRGGKLEFGYRWNRRAYFDCGAAIALLNRND
ncbi:hypothetical protein KKD57_05360 [Patescibacteria group bacterium]|nr:hypothetical protein [Patescibacteria group bacterium]